MQIFLFIVGAVALVAGLVTIAYGIPINQFSFGNTLIVVGTIAAIGGLIVLALGAVVSRLQQLGKALAAQPLQRLDRFDLPAPAQAKEWSETAHSKPEPKTESVVPEPRVVEPPLAVPTAEVPRPGPAEVVTAAPVLRNPAIPLAEVAAQKAPIQAPVAAPLLDDQKVEPARETPRRSFGFMRSVVRKEPTERPPGDRPSIPPPVMPPPLTEPHSRMSEETHFEAVWPAESKPELAQYGYRSPAPELRSDVPEPTVPAPALNDDRSKVAILKSGVVDGMGYTLYVDGSIEAELPQGTLRFSSINELRAHLEKTA